MCYTTLLYKKDIIQRNIIEHRVPLMYHSKCPVSNKKTTRYTKKQENENHVQKKSKQTKS